MRKDTVEIYSNQTNAAVMRHPNRAFPGVLLQGDTLFSLCELSNLVCREIGRSSPGFDDANELHDVLRSYLDHYKTVLVQHDIGLPFSE
jgi:hypothetical protein